MYVLCALFREPADPYDDAGAVPYFVKCEELLWSVRCVDESLSESESNEELVSACSESFDDESLYIEGDEGLSLFIWAVGVGDSR